MRSLIDLHLSGGRFTCTNLQQPPLLVRLDRFLVTVDWESHCPKWVQFRLKRPVSDHASIVVNRKAGVKARSPFRFDNFVLYHPTS